MRCHKMGVLLASEFLFTFALSVAVNDRLPSGGRFDDQLGIGEVPFASTLPEPPLHEQGQRSDLRVRLISYCDIVLTYFVNIPRYFRSTNYDN